MGTVQQDFGDTMNPTDIQPLIRLAATLPVGSLDRRTLLAALKKKSAQADDLVARVDVMSGSMDGKDTDRGPLLEAVQQGLPGSVERLEAFTAEAFPRYGVTTLDELRKSEDLTDDDRDALKSMEARIKPFSAMVKKVEKWSGKTLGEDLAEGFSLVRSGTDQKLREAVFAGAAKGMHGAVQKLESGRRIVTDTGRGSLTTPGALGVQPEDLVQVMMSGGVELPGMKFDKNMSDKTYYEGLRVRGTFKPRKELYSPGISIYTLAGAKIQPLYLAGLAPVKAYAKAVATTTAVDWKRSVHIGTEYILAEGDATAPDPEHGMNMGGKVSLESLLGADLIDGVTVSKQITLAKYYVKKIRQAMARSLKPGPQKAIWEAVAEMISQKQNPWKGQGRGGEFVLDYARVIDFLENTRTGNAIMTANKVVPGSVNKDNMAKNWLRVREKMRKELKSLDDDTLLASIHLSLAEGGLVNDVPEYIKKIKGDKDLYQAYLGDMRKRGSTRVAREVIKRATERRAMIRLAATLPVGSPERRAILAGCEKMKSPAMQESCEAMKAGKKPGKGKAKSDKKDDGKMPPELLEKFEKKKAGKGKVPDALKKHQFTSEDNPNPKGNDKDGDGKSGEKKPAGLKGKKAALVRLAATLPKGSDERKTILRMAAGA